MAIYHMSIKIGSRSKGQSAVAAAAYRSGEKLTDEETGLTSDYTRKGGVVFSEISLCENAPAEYANRETLWNAVHDIEKNKNAQLWREFEVALPKELNREEQIETVREYVNGLTKQGMCADWSLHDKGDGNPHAHIMATMRSITENGKWAAKSRLVYDLDEHGERIFQKVNKQGRKQYKNHKEDYNDWNAKERVEEWRAAWADCCNQRLERSLQIDHRSNQRRGIEEEPTIHEGYAARAIEQRGGIADRCQINREIQQRNSLLQELWRKLQEIEDELKKKLAEIADKAASDDLESRLNSEGKIKGEGNNVPQNAVQNLTESNKGESVNAGKKRIRDLLQRSRSVRANSGVGTERVEPRKIDVGTGAEVGGTGAEVGDDTATVIREARTAIASAGAKEQDSGTKRANRESERERQSIERSKKAIERKQQEQYAVQGNTIKSKSRGRSR
jgi:hypothetical protein